MADSVVFVNRNVGSLTTDTLDTHFWHHGAWRVTALIEDLSDPQYFLTDTTNCHPHDRANASDDFVASRYHVRYAISQTTGGDYGLYAPATPHYDQVRKSFGLRWDWPPVSASFGHCIPPRTIESGGTEEGGFQRAKVQLGRHWHGWNDGKHEHMLVRTENWLNTRPQPGGGCDGLPAYGDGNVDIIDINHLQNIKLAE